MGNVLVIGLDGATWKLIQPWVDQGCFPQLVAVQRQGSSAVLRSTIPVDTSTAWAAFMTGKEPSNTDIYNFYYRQRNPYHVRTPTRPQVRGTSLWKYLSHCGKKSIMIDVPMTYPAEEDPNILMIAGIPAPNIQREGFTHRPDLFERFNLKNNRYRITVRLPEYEGRYEELIADLKNMVKERLRVVDVLIQERWNLFVVHFYAMDVIQHALWRFADRSNPSFDRGRPARYGDDLLKVFSEVDEAIGKLPTHFDPNHAAILVMSDHGFSPNHWRSTSIAGLKKVGCSACMSLLLGLVRQSPGWYSQNYQREKMARRFSSSKRLDIFEGREEKDATNSDDRAGCSDLRGDRAFNQ